MLALINAERVKAGVKPVVLGDNVAAQLHAEDALENCFSSHWGLDGLKPYMRYSLAGGYQSNGENVSGLSYCYTPSSGYRELGPIEQEIREAMDGFMSSPGHRDNILRPWHMRVNIGLAWDSHNLRVVQHFEGDHVEYGVVPVIEDGVLTLSGTVKGGVAFLGSTDLSVGVFYDPPPNSLTRGQVARTYCYDYGQPVAFLRPPLTGNSYYPDDEFTDTSTPCPDPYDVPTDSQPPRSPGEANDLWQAAYEESQGSAETTITGRWVTASEWHAKDSSFSVKADLSDVLADQGPGVYTIIVWGWQPDADTNTLMSEYSIFHGITPPDTYTSETLPTATPAKTSTSTPTPVAEMSPAEVYARVSPSIPFIETAAATGSGVLIEGGYVVTNYHVVWPYESVWVVFPDGTELENVPVVGWDPMADLAVLGPVDVSAQPLRLNDGEGTALGSELLLVGYPSEVDLFPQPTVTRGILSRFREWERLGMTYFQTDAAIAGGQSGGALVNSRGAVVGISTFSFSEAGFGLAASSADIMPIAERLIQGEFTSELGDRRLPVGRGSFEVDFDLHNYWDTSTFVLDATAGTILEVGIEGSGDGWFHVSDPFGLILEVNDGYTGVEHGAVELLTSGVHFLQVEMASGESSSFDVSSSVRLIPLNDPDDGQTVAVGETLAGSLDHLLDWDWYSVRLNEGQTVRIATDSINVDTVLYVDFPKSRNNQVVSDDDSGGGFGGNSELVYRAPHTGEYFIAVTEAVGDRLGGYYLSVEPARQGTETVSVPPSPQTVDSRFGTMVVFEDPSGYFSIQAPEAWLERELDESQGEVFYAFDPETNSDVLIITEDVLALGAGELTLTKYADLIESSVLIPAGAEDITRETVQTSQGLPAVIFEMSLYNTHRVIRMVYLFEDNIAVSITYSFPNDRFDMGKELAAYFLDSFQVE